MNLMCGKDVGKKDVSLWQKYVHKIRRNTWVNNNFYNEINLLSKLYQLYIHLQLHIYHMQVKVI